MIWADLACIITERGRAAILYRYRRTRARTQGRLVPATWARRALTRSRATSLADSGLPESLFLSDLRSSAKETTSRLHWQTDPSWTCLLFGAAGPSCWRDPADPRLTAASCPVCSPPRPRQPGESRHNRSRQLIHRSSCPSPPTSLPVCQSSRSTVSTTDVLECRRYRHWPGESTASLRTRLSPGHPV